MLRHFFHHTNRLTVHMSGDLNRMAKESIKPCVGETGALQLKLNVALDGVCSYQIESNN